MAHYWVQYDLTTRTLQSTSLTQLILHYQEDIDVSLVEEQTHPLKVYNVQTKVHSLSGQLGTQDQKIQQGTSSST